MVRVMTNLPHSELNKKWRRAALVVAKLAVSAALVWFAFRNIPISEVIARPSGANPWYILGAVLSFALIPCLQAERWRVILKALGYTVRMAVLQKLMWIGLLFNHIFPSSIGGDALRLWYLRAENVPLKVSATSVITDRAMGVGVLFLYSSLMLPWLFEVISDPMATLVASALSVGGLAAFGIAVWIGPVISLPGLNVLTQMIQTGTAALRTLLMQWRSALEVLAISIASQLLQSSKILFVAAALGVKADWQIVMALVPPLMLLLALPISIGGWGIRENAMVVGLGWVGVSAVDALAVSILTGIISIFVALPGAVLWYQQRIPFPMSTPEEKPTLSP